MTDLDKHILRQSVIHLYHLFSAFFFPLPFHLQVSRQTELSWFWITASMLAGSPVPCTSAFHISRDTSCELAFVSLFCKRPNLPPQLLFTVTSSCLRVLLRILLMFESKLPWWEGPLSAGMIRCPDGNSIWWAVCWPTSSVHPIWVWERFWNGSNTSGFF